MTHRHPKNVHDLDLVAEKCLKSERGQEILFVAAVDIEGDVSIFLPERVSHCEPVKGACKAAEVLESNAVSYVVFEGDSRHARISSGGTKLHIKR
jgi:hypothetical protein